MVVIDKVDDNGKRWKWMVQLYKVDIDGGRW